MVEIALLYNSVVGNCLIIVDIEPDVHFNNMRLL